ncbi:MAG: Holliday junction resolvase RuvX [Muribaculaceae bacterium]|nr:Holliday junction resolvase RuvX [Muribaculaceae bacterium]
MGRIMAIDYGRKRCGVAVTDALRISANSLPVVRSCDLLQFVVDYCNKETVDRILIGRPLTMRGELSESNRFISPFLGRLKKALPDMTIEEVDERFTSSQAHKDMIAAGFKKSDRQRKGLADEMSAVLILTAWLETH